SRSPGWKWLPRTMTDAPKSTVATGLHAAPTTFLSVAIDPFVPTARSTYGLHAVTAAPGTVRVTVPPAVALPAAVPVPAPVRRRTTFSFALKPTPRTVKGFKRTTCSVAVACRASPAPAGAAITPTASTSRNSENMDLIDYLTDLMYAVSAFA